MENRMVEKLIDNKYDFENAELAFVFMKENIEICFPDFFIIDSSFSLSSNGSYSRFGFFYFVYHRNDIEFKLECERGVLLHEIKINDSVSRLHSYEHRMKDVLACSKKNIVFTLSVLKRWIDE